MCAQRVADTGFGVCQKYLVKILARIDIDVMRYDRSRVLEVKPHGVNKGLAATAILESLWIKADKEIKAEHQAAATTPTANRTPANRTPASTTTAAGPPSRFDLRCSPPAHTPLASAPSSVLSPRSATTEFHPFVLAIGDDRSDEEMFNSVQHKSYLAGSVRGRERAQPVDAFSHTIASHSIVSAVPATPANTFHDTEVSPTPMSPTLVGGGRSARHSSPASTDPFLFTCCVGMKPSSAHYYLNSVEEVLRSLYGLVLKDQEKKATTSATGALATIGGTAVAGIGEDDRLSGARKPLGLTKRIAAIREESEGGLGPKRGSFGALASMLFSKKE